jgi:DNA-binding transcriptional ArsR family regulator
MTTPPILCPPASGKLVFGIFAALAEFERELISERTKVGELCKELGVTRQTLYRHVSPTGELREDGAKLLDER